jgi:hypothetical protein
MGTLSTFAIGITRHALAFVAFVQLTAASLNVRFGSKGVTHQGPFAPFADIGLPPIPHQTTSPDECIK